MIIKGREHSKETRIWVFLTSGRIEPLWTYHLQPHDFLGIQGAKESEER